MIRITIAMKKALQNEICQSPNLYTLMRSKTNQNVSCSRLLKKGEQAPDTSPSVKNQFNIEAPV